MLYEVITMILGYVQSTNVKKLGYVGLVVLLFTALSLLSTIEKAFNDIWGVAKGRTPWRKFTDFFSVTLICPLLLIVGFSITVSMQNESVVQKILSVTAFNYIYLVVLKALPYVIRITSYNVCYTKLLRTLPYDVLSLNAGSRVPIPGGISRLPPDVWTVKPIERLVEARQRLAELARSRGRVAVLVVGGGPAGLEVAGNALSTLVRAGGIPRVTLAAGA